MILLSDDVYSIPLINVGVEELHKQKL